MFYYPITLPQRAQWKWCAYLLVLLMPGSFIVLPALWLARQVSVRAWRR